jgi:hypothetical protein
MADDKENKSSNVRLPGELLAELRKEQAPWLARGVEAPTFGELLYSAWKAAKAMPSAEVLEIVEILEGPDTTESKPLKAAIKVALSEHRKRKAKTETASPGKEHRREKLG